MPEKGVQSLGGDDPLEEGLATHSRVLAWSIPWTEEPGGLQSVGSQESDTTEQLTLRGLPWWPSGCGSELPIQGARFQFLIGEAFPHAATKTQGPNRVS